MIKQNTRDFMKNYKIKGNKVVVTLGTGEKIIYPIEEKNNIKTKFDKEIRDLQNIKEKAKSEKKRRKIHSYLNVGIMLGSLITLGSIAPALLPILSLGGITALNGVFYLANKKKIKALDKTINSEEISNLIYELQKSQKENSEQKEYVFENSYSNKKTNDIDNITTIDNEMENETYIRKAA